MGRRAQAIQPSNLTVADQDALLLFVCFLILFRILAYLHSLIVNHKVGGSVHVLRLGQVVGKDILFDLCQQRLLIWLISKIVQNQSCEQEHVCSDVCKSWNGEAFVNAAGET